MLPSTLALMQFGYDIPEVREIGMEQVTFRDTIPQAANARFIRVRAVKP
jgi:hypothetical protein